MRLLAVGLFVFEAGTAIACASRRVEGAGQAGVREVEARAPTPIFRFVGLRPGVVRLGEPLPPALRAALGAQPGDTVINAPRTTFSGAERLVLFLGRSGVVRGALFDYSQRADYEAMVKDYEHDLGPARRSQQRRRGEEPADLAAWEDAQTIFRLRRDPNRNAWTVRAELWDRAAAPR